MTQPEPTGDGWCPNCINSECPGDLDCPVVAALAQMVARVEQIERICDSVRQEIEGAIKAVADEIVARLAAVVREELRERPQGRGQVVRGNKRQRRHRGQGW